MADLNRIDGAQAVEITDGLNQSVSVQNTDTTGGEIGVVTREARIGQKTMSNSFPVTIASDQSTSYAEDSGHFTGENGNFVLGVRNDAGTSLVNANGDYAPFQMDASGKLLVSSSSDGTVSHDAADSGNPLKVGGKASTSSSPVPAVADNDRVDALFDSLGKQVVLIGSRPETLSDGYVELTNTTSTETIAAAGASIRTMLTHITVSNASNTDILVTILDGVTKKWSAYLAAQGGGAVVDLAVPFKGSANTAWNAKVDTSGWTATTPDGVYVTLVGYKAR